MLLPYLALGIVLVIVVHTLLKATATANPHTLRRVKRVLLYALLIGVSLYLLRLGLVHYATVIAIFTFLFAVVQRLSMAHGLWRAVRGNKQKDSPAAPSKKMTKAEAAAILGIDENASAEEVQEAHRRLIRRNHPDKGGSEFLAGQINSARDTLLKTQ